MSAGETSLRLAAVQAAPVWLDRDATLTKACSLIADAAAGGADFVGFPENFLPGHPVWFYFHPVTSGKSMDLAVELYKNSVEIPGPQTDALCQAAADAGVFVVIGVTERRPNQTGTLFNTQLFIDRRGEIVGKHQKLVPTIGERIVHAGGSGASLRAFSSEFGPVSGLCCGENSNPMALSVLAAEYTRIHVASWPNHFIPGYWGMCESSQLASQNVAYICKCFVISACSTNSPEMIERLPVTESDAEFLRDSSQTGGSVIVNPRGVVIAGPMSGAEEGILYADVNLDDTIRGRLVHDFGGHYNRADILHLSVNEAASDLLTRVERRSSPRSGGSDSLPGRDGAGHDNAIRAVAAEPLGADSRRSSEEPVPVDGMSR